MRGTRAVARLLGLVVLISALCVGCGGAASSSDENSTVPDGASLMTLTAVESDGAGTTDSVTDGTSAASPAQLVDQTMRGNVVFYAISEVDRPLYGWKYFTTVAYCANGRFALQSRGERRTVLDNTEYRSDQGSGRWRALDRPDGSVAMELAFDDGRRTGFLITVSPSGSLDHGPSVNAQLRGPAGC